MQFEWDENKNKANIKKHSISFEVSVYVFSDKEAITIYDDEHSLEEQRWVTIGKIKNTSVIVVIHTYRIRDNYEFIRIISARKANKKEAKLYFENMGKKAL